jgi:hypothetical protein
MPLFIYLSISINTYSYMQLLTDLAKILTKIITKMVIILSWPRRKRKKQKCASREKNWPKTTHI